MNDLDKALRLLYDTTTDFITVIDRDFRILHCNLAVRETWGENLPGTQCFAAYRGRSDVCPDCAARRSFSSGKPEYSFLPGTDNSPPMELYAYPVFDDAGRVTRVVEHGRNVSDRLTRDEALRKSEERFRAIVDAEPECVKIIGPDQRLVMMNPAGLAMIEASSLDQVRGKDVAGLVVPEQQEEFREMVRKVLAGEEGHLVFQVTGLKGTARWLETRSVPLRDADGEIDALLGVTRDITAGVAAEEELKEKERFIRSILDNVDEGFLVIDRDCRIVTANRSYCKTFGITRGELAGKHCYEVTHGSATPCFERGEQCTIQEVFRTGRPAALVHTHQSADGSIDYVETKAYPLTVVDGEVRTAIQTLNNITERHLLEEQQLKAQKLEAIGTLAGGIAHDFNNLLQGVFGYLSMARSQMDGGHQAVPLLEEAERALHVATGLTSQLLTFSKGGKPVKKRVDLGSIVRSGVAFALSGSRNDYRVAVDDGPWTVEADEGQIGQVVQNIVLNAGEAMPDGGTVTVTIGGVSVASSPGGPEERWVEASISDEGIGIPEEHLARIFDPYFTTKQKGSGLGLATSYSIVRNHGGTLTVESEQNRGSTFRMRLPVAGGKAKQMAAPKGPAPHRDSKILIMDDDQVILKVMRKMLLSMGHVVETAVHGEEAVSKYRQAMEEGSPFDLTILDLTIRGGVGGEETLKRLKEIDPGVRAVVTSGYSESESMSRYGDAGFVGCLKKPYSLETLREAMAPLLGD